MALQLGQVEVGAEPAEQALPAVVEDVQPEVEQAGRDGFAVDREVLLGQVPAPGPHDQGGGLVGQGGRSCPG